MKLNWKLVLNFLLVSIISAGVAIGVYAYLNKNDNQLINGEFNQAGYHPVGLAVAAENTDFSLAAERSVHAVVHIKSIAKPNQRERNFFDPFEFFFGGQPYYQRQPRVGFGSGVIISTDGYVVTNNHVIEGADEIEITTNDDQVHTAKLIGSDEATDIALLKIAGKDFPIIPFGDSDALKVGEWVLAVGNPFNLTSTVTAGIVSAKGRGSLFSGYGNMTQRGQAQEKVESYIQTDAAVNPGNSGGALVNTRGELVGINTAIYSETGNYVGYSFAIPISIVKKVVSDIKQYGVVQRALLGVTIIELPMLKEIDPEKYNQVKAKDGVYVGGFSSKSSSEKAGIKKGDVIVAINDQKIHNFQELRAQISRYSPGDIVNVQIQRGEELKTYKVELKNDQGTTEAITGKKALDILGASLSDITLENPVLGTKKGVKISDLKNGKLKQAGIRDGFIILIVNDENIDSAKKMENLVESVMKNEPEYRGLFIKGIYPNGRLDYYAINLNE